MNQQEITTRVSKIQNQLLQVARTYADRLEEPDINDLIMLSVTNKLVELDPDLKKQLVVDVRLNPVTGFIGLAFHRVH